MILRLPCRPEPSDPRAKLVVEWAEVLFYVFCLLLSATALVLGLLVYGPEILHRLR